EHVKDGPGEQRSAGFDPVIVEAAAVRIDDHVHDVLNVFGFVLGSEAHLFERVVLAARARRVGGYDDSGAFSAASRSEDQHVARPGIEEEANARATLPASQIDSSAMRLRSN